MTADRPAMTMREVRERLGHTIPPDAPEPPAAWVDGDPLMEAIAAAVWEHCETDGLSLVVDDPRNIAATAAAVARTLSSAPANRAELRDRDRALALLEAADFLRDAHFRDGLSVQEIGTALRHTADAADPMVGSLARDGFGLDEIAAMPDTAALPAPADRTARWEAAAHAAGREVDRNALAVYMAVADAEQAELRRERDLAVAHDRQPYPTAWAYEQACKALHRKEAAIDRVLEFAGRLDETGRQLAGPDAVHPVAAHIRHLLDTPAGEAQQPEAQALPQPEGPEYTPCECGHIEPEHKPNVGACRSCDCEGYRATPPAPLRRSEADCPGFPERCPNLRPVDPSPPVHFGGVRCGCADDAPQPEAAEGAQQ
jgi:hypothetical protein